ncbi:MAG: hypothetical protein K6F37_09590 [Lachnospiraceae bacterium]|nr:hypothetical protein [Lachnospiraceae bacterium]
MAGIAPIGAYSSMSRIEPLNYSIKNEADFSDAFNENQVTGKGKVDSVSPVTYPNASVSESSKMPEVDTAKKMQATKEYNDVALSFGGMNTGYSSSAASIGYATTGSMFDAYI